MNLPDAVTVALLSGAGGLVGGVLGGIIAAIVALRQLRSEEQRWALEGRPAARFTAFDQLLLTSAKHMMALLYLHEIATTSDLWDKWPTIYEEGRESSRKVEDATLQAVSFLNNDQRLSAYEYQQALATWLQLLIQAKDAHNKGVAIPVDELEKAKNQAIEKGNIYLETIANLVNPLDLQQRTNLKK